ncbi:TetR/AcrR family transcriptional regulator [Loigolactobacillus jiayinensis]|uniref:TetR/AcrR family transcriptional regulator n=1 Tax=Loigolactobacillus jiayinensis TaxID=2486016 RepID=A0ABW1RCT7_9LACO|nr:TetR family transcriptional regulator [Loigolactobacillus jiayinensis]
MVSTTFNNLPAAKKARIEAALLQEFSDYSLAQAQVARIVVQAQIARGAFYKYFTDLTDAYQYLYRQAMTAIHRNVSRDNTPHEYMLQVQQFTERTANSQYYQLIKRHVTQNEALLPDTTRSAMPANIPSSVWAAAILIHATIKQILTDPSSETQALQRLEQVLTVLHTV